MSMRAMARMAIALHTPPDFSLRILRQHGTNPISFEWLAECPDRKQIGGSVLFQEHGDYSVCISMERNPSDPHDNGWSFPRRWQHGTID